MTVLLGCIIGFLLILGISQLWEWLLLYWFHPREAPLRYEVIPLKGSVQDLEQLLRYVRLTSEGREIVVVDAELDHDSRELCRHLCAMQPELHFLNMEQAKMLIFPENNLER